MKSFNFEGTKYDLNPKNIIGEGRYGIVYHFNKDNCIKVFKNRKFYLNKISLISQIKELKLPYFYEIKDLVYDEQGFAGYIMKFYRDRKINLLREDSEFLVNVFRSLIESVDKLTFHGILISDMFIQNVILNYDEFHIIDVDNFSYSNLSYGELLQKNRKELNTLIRCLLANSLDTYYDYDSRVRVDFEYILANFNINEFINLIKYYDTPLDYVLKK